jgi:enoyl-CoA hydratase
MKSEIVHYRLRDSIAEITLDDGKRNVLSHEMIAAIGRALDRAEADRAVVLLSGREDVFSAGFDLHVLRAGGTAAFDMVRSGFELAERIFSFPAPVVVACTGHAIAMGAFLLLAADLRIGAAGPYKIGANEVALGITMPHFGVEICRQRLTPAHFHRAVIHAEMYGPDDAGLAGFLDRVVPASDLRATASAEAADLRRLDLRVQTASKLRARAPALAAIRAAIEADGETFRAGA